MDGFKNIPVRKPGLVDVSWWNSLRSAGVRAEKHIFGLGGSEWVARHCLNDASDGEIEGLVFDSESVKVAFIDMIIMRKSDTAGSERIQQIRRTAIHINGGWEILNDLTLDLGAESGVEITIDSASGQVGYESDDLAGDNYQGQFWFRFSTLGGYANA